MPKQKVIVVGLGAHGSSTAYHLASRGIEVMGIDQYHPPHSMGSSHGPSRVFREAYKEGPDYVPFLRRARELWNRLNTDSGMHSFEVTGGLFMGPPTGFAMTEMQATSKIHDVEVEILTPAEVRKRFPVFRIPDGWEAIYEVNSSTIFPEVAVEAHLSLAAKAGADLHYDERVEGWSAASSGVTVRTSRGEYHADRLVLTAGVWIPELLAGLDLPLTVERVTLWMIKPRANAEWFMPGKCPNTSWELGERYPLYIQADYGTGVKVALDHHGTPTTAETVSRETTDEDRKKIFSEIRRFVPDLDGEVLDSAVCMYMNTPDLNFVVDHHPEHENVIVASVCSGHGFKFSTVMGEILADLATEGKSRFDLDIFSAKRFG
ncbi:MAG: N-methyl-L-tryptophan oxidase [Chloroflexi bacterium]|nr:MAG: N-methyl-L-tryptophan oxidase [Chloroflexota bacterium]